MPTATTTKKTLSDLGKRVVNHIKGMSPTGKAAVIGGAVGGTLGAGRAVINGTSVTKGVAGGATLGATGSALTTHLHNKIAGHLDKQEELVKKLIKRRQLIGAAVGGVTGAAGLGAMQHKINKNPKAHKDRKGSAVAAGVVGGISGAYFGHVAGGIGAYRRASRSDDRAWKYRMHKIRKGFDDFKKDWKSSSGGGYEGYRRRHGSSGAGGASSAAEKFWKKVPEGVQRKVKATAAHAKRTQGPEGENAKRILHDLAKKHGFSAEDAIKHASLVTYTIVEAD